MFEIHVHESDLTLLGKMSKGDQGAFKEIYRRYWRKCFLLVFQRSKNLELAEDLTQQIFISLWEKRETVAINNLSGYLYSAVKFKFISYIKGQVYGETYRTYAQQNNAVASNAVEQSLHLKEMQEAIDKGVAVMSPKTKEVYRLSRTEYYSVKEIAHMLDISEKAVEYHITQSLRTMRLALKDFLPALLAASLFF